MKKILHISKYYYPFKGGTEQVARDCVNALKDRYEQKVLCFSENKDDSVDDVDEVEVIRTGCFAKISSQSLSGSYRRILKKTISVFGPDIIIFHYPNPFVAHYLLKQIPLNCKLVIYWHLDIIRQKFLRIFFCIQNKRLIRRADILIATSPNYIEGSKYLSAAKEKCVVIPNCISEERLELSPEIERRAEDIRRENQGKTICVAVGRHTKYKGFEYLIRAAHLLDDSFQFFLIGKGEETKKLVEEAGNDKKIHFLGALSDEELKAYMFAMDIFCFTSITRNEAFGIALVEAMFYKKPIVYFSNPGSGENYVCVNGKTAIEVPACDIRTFSNAIIELSNNSELKRMLGNNGYERACNTFMMNHYREHIQDLIKRVH